MADAPRTDWAFCPQYHHAVELIGKRWTGVILRTLIAGLSRYAEIRAAVPHLSDTMLGQRLRELEAEGIVTREVAPGPPIRVDYRLTEKGRALDEAITALSNWADTWVEQPAPPQSASRAQRTKTTTSTG
jgi:DNA-binding HxlR family transcriptional regulator